MLDTLAARPITTKPNVTHDEWAGSTLQRLLRSPKAVAETWAFFSGPQQPARIVGANGLTMEQLVARRPAVLGPAGRDPANHNQKYFFVKVLDPSDFPRFAYVGFNPATVRRLRMTPARFKRWFASRLWDDRQALEQFAALIRPRVRSAESFARLKAVYKRWAIAQATADWEGRARCEVRAFVAAGDVAEARGALERQRAARRTITRLLHRIDFEDGQAILIETPTLHAIAGLSLQLHPRATDNFYPKDELWIYKEVPFPAGRRGWVLIEPQRTFDKTESGADFFTPFAWRDGRVEFRKSITRAYLDAFVALMDATPRPRARVLRAATPVTIGHTRGCAQWYRLVEEPGWPHFVVRELRVRGMGEATMPLAHRSFIELHVTQGAVAVTLARGPQRCRLTVRPATPVFLPATLPYDTITYRATAPASLHWFSRQ